MSDDRPKSMRELADLATPISLRIAATLRLADRVGDEGATVGELAAATAAVPEVLGRVLDHLLTAGVFVRAGDRYLLTEAGNQLKSDVGGLCDELDVNGAIGRAALALAELPGTVTTGAPAYETRYGRGFWQDLSDRPELQESFDAKMTTRLGLIAPQIAARFDWGRFPAVVDVGGGAATLLVEVLRAHEGVHGRIVELEPTADAAAKVIEAAGLAGRAEAVPGSFFDPLPSGADAYVLSDILHNWDDTRASEILANCARAVAPGGSVLVIEQLREAAADTAIDLWMLAAFNGRERTGAEISALAEPCGLRLKETAQVADQRTLLEFIPR